MQGYYIGWVGFNNLGDEALWNLCTSYYSSVRWSLISPHPSFLTDPIESGGGPALALLGGGTLINSVSERWLLLYQQLRKAIHLPVLPWGTGVEDPRVFSGISTWRDQRVLWKEQFADLPMIGVRGPRSKVLLDEAGIKNVVVVGDPIVLHHRAILKLSAPIENFAKPTLRIGVNFGFPAVPMLGKLNHVEEELSRAVHQLMTEGHQVVIFAVWYRDILACMNLASKLGIPTSSVKLLSSTDGALQFLSSLDIAISFRLHSAILACARNVPVIMLEYTPKCLDFAASIDLEQYVISCQSVTADQIVDTFNRIRSSLPQLREQISHSMRGLADRFRQFASNLVK